MTNNIEQQIEQERNQARNACDSSGADSKECAAAWDAVEELQAEAAHQKQKQPQSSFENYCEDNPDAAECRVYDN
ncbi:MAG: Calvin cycle protein CP12 [Microcoleaceae cyanobacterium]